MSLFQSETNYVRCIFPSCFLFSRHSSSQPIVFILGVVPTIFGDQELDLLPTVLWTNQSDSKLPGMYLHIAKVCYPKKRPGETWYLTGDMIHMNFEKATFQTVDIFCPIFKRTDLLILRSPNDFVVVLGWWLGIHKFHFTFTIVISMWASTIKYN